MARTSKKKQAEATVVKKPLKTYSVGIYARLSVDSNDRKNESIETQIEIAKAFMAKQDDMVLFDCYTDIGKTGTNFEREGFERMMRDVRTRKIDCIIVKDLSRFGRNHVETGNYIEKIFPFLGVRFIAVTDDFDSMNITSQNELLGLNLKNLVNEMYAKDIAMKVKSTRKMKWEQGSFAGGAPSYGYKAEWINGKKCLFPDEVTADIVRKIYELFLSGWSMRKIIRWLYEQRIVSPREYYRTGKIYCDDTEKLRQWGRTTVKRVLVNPIYIGWLVQASTNGKEYKLRKKHDVDSDDWSVKQNTHEPIISEETFFKVAQILERNLERCHENGFSKLIPPEEDIFADVLFCGDCGAKMQRITTVNELSSQDRVRIYNYNCSNAYWIDSRKCITKAITLTILIDIVKKAIQQEFSLSAMRPKEMVECNNKEAERMKREWNIELSELEKQMENIKRIGSELYLKYRMGEMEENSFKQIKEENDRKITVFQNKKKEIEEKLRKIDYEAVKRNHFLRTLVKGTEKSELTAEVIQTLIDRIEVYQDHRVKVIFAFKREDVLLAEKGGI